MDRTRLVPVAVVIGILLHYVVLGTGKSTVIYDDIYYETNNENITLKGPNVCTKLELIKARSLVTEYQNREISNEYLCLKNFHLKCVFSFNRTVPVIVEREVTKHLLFKQCCDGYKPSLHRTHCIPVCEKPCKWGKCILPNICQCDKLYAGKTCDIRIAVCPLGTYGVNCSKKCHCPNNSYCDPFEGHCFCPAGFMGPYCNTTCSSGFYGHECQYKCNCPHDRTCDRINGTCEGSEDSKKDTNVHNLYTWKKTSQNKSITSCKPAAEKCHCRQTHKGRICECEPGWKGYVCKIPCSNGTFGQNCSSICNCHKGLNCRHTDGICLCPPGFYGPECIQNDTSVLQIDQEKRNSIWIVNVSIIFSFFLFSTIGIGMLIYYFYYYRHKMQDLYNRRNATRSELRENTSTEDANIGTISIVYNGERMTGWNTSYTNKMFYLTYGNHNNSSHYETEENLYFEIDEIAPRRGDDLYDHLDFLRPTGSWKPHYQKALVMQEQLDQSSSRTNSRSSLKT
ncbi:Laminin EGF domain,EGF-like, conserved site,EGF-like domain [Cinara cedri]|uniref:Laminin EGF domain,EGF-like, conserved site,EGF-like domain n=1 Tax=Cinara cedri TaxID=506608 RepID=A0A5E4M1U3_9HEMI|nr:Laminin EGF domain,EGF-like, conserved site,EGF-like domain [Cinara cedri]